MRRPTVEEDAASSPRGFRHEEAGLVARLRAGDEAAFVDLVEGMTPAMLRMARLYTSAAVAEEVTQDTWLAVVRGVDAFEGRASLRTWIFGILLNIARTKGERERRQIPYSAFIDPAADRAESAVEAERFRPPGDAWAGHWVSYPRRWDELPEERWPSREATSEIRAIVDALPPAQREVVTLRDVIGWSSVEVCQALGITAVNQRVLLHRGRAHVRRALEALAHREAGASAEAGPEVNR
ncbi:MAG: sigma-70 family RNA polymerase sigma factor [Chloroflexi bacterium]|nr:sigma-70 family RNA polymerase sigma factor [Chloroflexota bacterium]